MCGIHLLLQQQCDFCVKNGTVDKHPSHLHRRRGPDYSNTIQLECGSADTANERDHILTLQSTVLNMQQHMSLPQPSSQSLTTMCAQPDAMNQQLHLGNLTKQPVTNSSSIDNCRTIISTNLAWNGEIYEIIRNSTRQSELSNDDVLQQKQQSDTTYIAELFHTAALQSDTLQSLVQCIYNTLHDGKECRLNGEYAFCYTVTIDTIDDNVSTNSNTYILYGKDPIGRRSLLLRTKLATIEEADEYHKIDGTVCVSKPILEISSIVPVEDNENKKFESSPTSTTPETKHHQSDAEWIEIEPGIVYGYHVEAATSSSATFSAATTATNNGTNMTATELGTSATIEDASYILEETLSHAVEIRIQQQSSFSTPQPSMPPPPISILFSGGLDSTVLASLALQYTNTVVLLTVSFVRSEDEKQVLVAALNTVDDTTSSPDITIAADTIAAFASYQDLKKRHPSAHIELRHRIVTWDEMQIHEKHVRSVLKPKDSTIMDINIGTAFWFAVNDSTAPRIVLSGLGADELMGGYGRHRKAYTNNSGSSTAYDAVRAEMNMDICRLWERNLGRDDRIISDTGHEVRFPFLDIHVVDLLTKQLNIEQIVDYSSNGDTNNLPGDKRILRILAQRLGVTTAAFARKRAIQFGCRIAHVADTKRFGSRSKSSGTATIPSAKNNNINTRRKKNNHNTTV